MEKESEIKRYYLMPEVWVTVTQSQVFNWVKKLNEEGIDTDCISISNHKYTNDETNRFENELGGSFIWLRNFNSIILSDIVISISLLRLYASSFRKYKKIIFQTRVSSVGIPFLVLRFLPKVRLIFESRGIKIEEKSHSNSDKPLNFKSRLKRIFSIWNIKVLILVCNKIICVSNCMKEYYLKNYHLKDEQLVVIPGAADSESFFPDSKMRLEVRKRLGVKNSDVLVVYSGRLEMKWEIPDSLASFFDSLSNLDPNFKLLLLTPDISIGEVIFGDLIRRNKCIIETSDFENVNKYLNASDMGILLRENVIMNNVASPTKFAEYILVGLPVIISDSVKDFSQIVRETGFGVTVSETESISESEYDTLCHSLTIGRNRIAKWGLESLSKSSFAKIYKDLLSTI